MAIDMEYATYPDDGDYINSLSRRGIPGIPLIPEGAISSIVYEGREPNENLYVDIRTEPTEKKRTYFGLLSFVYGVLLVISLVAIVIIGYYLIGLKQGLMMTKVREVSTSEKENYELLRKNVESLQEETTEMRSYLTEFNCLREISDLKNGTRVKRRMKVGVYDEQVTCGKYNESVFIMLSYKITSLYFHHDGENYQSLQYSNSLEFIKEIVRRSTFCMQIFNIESNQITAGEVEFIGAEENVKGSSPECINCSNLFKNEDIILKGNAYIDKRRFLPLKGIKIDERSLNQEEEYVKLNLQKLMCTNSYQ